MWQHPGLLHKCILLFIALDCGDFWWGSIRGFVYKCMLQFIARNCGDCWWGSILGPFFTCMLHSSTVARRWLALPAVIYLDDSKCLDVDATPGAPGDAALFFDALVD